MDPARQSVIDAVRAQYLLHWGGTHGFPHWERVRENGLRLAAGTNARAPEVIARAWKRSLR
jgi:hypothetical protein